MQRHTIFFITVNALHFSGGFSAHPQELKHCTHSIGYVSKPACLLPLAWVSDLATDSNIWSSCD